MFKAACLVFIFLINLMVCTIVNAQSDSSRIHLIDGKKYYIHKVEKGETMYGISKQYEVEVIDIALENPLTINGLKAGQELKIPLPAKKIQIRTLDGKHFLHTVDQGETLYSLSKKYNKTIEEIKDCNPELISGLKVGMTIKIPLSTKETYYGQEISDLLPEHSDLSAETKPVRDTVVYDSIVFKDNYDIVMMLPFFLDNNDSLEKNMETDDQEEIYPMAKAALEFYEGAVMASDSIKQSGFNFKIHVFDTNNDSAQINNLIAKESVKNAELIIGPLYSSQFNAVADFAGKNQISIVTPILTGNHVLTGNPYISKSRPCLETNIEEIACYIMNNYLDNHLVIIHSNHPEERGLVETFKKTMGEDVNILNGIDSTGITSPERKTMPSSQKQEIKTIIFNDEHRFNEIEGSLSLADTNVIIIPSENQVLVSTLISKLNKLPEQYQVIVFGLPAWEQFKNLESDHLHRLNVHISSSFYVNYESEAVKSFEKSYFKKYSTYPGNYAFLGFDITWYYLNALKNFGYRFQSHLPEAREKLMHNEFRYHKTPSGGGYENKHVFILKYEDFRIVRKN